MKISKSFFGCWAQHPKPAGSASSPHYDGCLSPRHHRIAKFRHRTITEVGAGRGAERTIDPAAEQKPRVTNTLVPATTYVPLGRLSARYSHTTADNYPTSSLPTAALADFAGAVPHLLPYSPYSSRCESYDRRSTDGRRAVKILLTLQLVAKHNSV